MNLDSTLPQQYRELLSSAVKFYENKKYDKAIRNCDKILQDKPDHCETLAIKALVLNQKGEHDTAMTLAKRGLMKGLGNFTCWHIFGILNRTIHKHEEARSAFQKAHGIQPKNQQVLRDLAQIQAQGGDFEGYLDSRTKLLNIKSDVVGNWVGRGVGEYMVGNFQTSFNIFKSVLEFATDHKDFSPAIRSEIYTFMARCLNKKGKFTETIEFLEENNKSILEKEKYWEAIAEAARNSQKFDKEKQALEELLNRNHDNYKTIDLYASLGGRSEQENLTELLKLQELYPKSKAVHKIILGKQQIDTPEGKAAFRDQLEKYLKPLIIKGVPSVVAEIKFLYKLKGKPQILEEVLSSFLEGKGLEIKKDPTLELWILFYLACHYDRIRELEKARDFIQKAIQHTPTQVDLFTLKARIIKHCGDAVQAAQVYNYARELDEADRYLNAKCAKYYLRAGRLETADELMKKFVRDPQTGMLNVHEMQCMWWECELGEAARQQGDLQLSLKNVKEVEQHFRHFTDDMFEFHNYCLRKNQVMVYVDMMEWQRRLTGNPFYPRAIIPLLKVQKQVLRQREKFEDVISKNKDEAVKIEQAVLKARGQDEWRRPDRDIKGLYSLNSVLKANEKERTAFRVKLASELVTYNSSSLRALYWGCKQLIETGYLVLALKAMLKLSKNFKGSAEFYMAVVRFQRALKLEENAKSREQLADLFLDTMADNFPSEEEAKEALKKGSVENLQFAYYCEAWVMNRLEIDERRVRQIRGGETSKTGIKSGTL